MYKAILFDLDNTLLGNSMEEIFGPAWFQMLIDYFAPIVSPEKGTPALVAGVQATDACKGEGPTIAEAFWASFCPLADCHQEEIEPLNLQFYAEEFIKLRGLTQRLPEARPVVELAFERGLQVVIATGALAPRTAAEQRLAWAGVPVTDFDYAFVTTWDIMHASKPYPEYYQEILANLEQKADECIMVGDNWDEDIIPTARLGISSYWITEPGKTRFADDLPLLGQGTLSDFLIWFKSESK
jgi:HAD superfamily hydrolase (TIGR01549 family)